MRDARFDLEGDQYDVMTAVETGVFDVKSRRMLTHAAGTGTVKGQATWVGFAERSRQARTDSFGTAVTKMIDGLHREVKAFRERAPTDPMIQLVLPPGYNPGTPPAARLSVRGRPTRPRRYQLASRSGVAPMRWIDRSAPSYSSSCVSRRPIVALSTP